MISTLYIGVIGMGDHIPCDCFYILSFLKVLFENGPLGFDI